MSGLRLDDCWAMALAQSLETNSTIEIIDLESNGKGSSGLLALISALSKPHFSVTEMLLRHQSKPMASTGEEKIPDLIANNDIIVKLSVDVRGTNAKCTIDQKIRRNQELRRKNRNKHHPTPN